MFRTLSCLLSLILVLGAVSATAEAELIDVTTGNVIFLDSFETGTVGNPPALTEPQVGTYATVGIPESPSYNHITDAATAGYAPYAGNQMLTINLGPSGDVMPIIDATGVTANSGEGELIRLSCALHPDSGVPSLFLTYGAGRRLDNSLGQLNFLSDGSIMWYTAFASGVSTTLTQTCAINEWNTIDIEHTNGTNVFSISINGGTAETCYGRDTFDTWDSFQWWPGVYNTKFSIDMVPEPGTLSLSIAILAFVSFFAWGSRKSRK